MEPTRINRRRPAHYRAIFISDVHLGFSGCSAEYLLDFLRSTTCDVLYLVGDIVDLWQMKRRLYWPQAHNDVVRTILGKAKHGTRIIYVCGNHDELLRDFVGMTFGNLEIHDEYIHKSPTGKKFLVIHGDQFDTVVMHSKSIAMLGSWLYDWLLRMNTVTNYLRRKLGFPYWSLAKMLKNRVKHAVNYISNFEHAVTYAANKYQVDGLVSGHIHHAEINIINDILYCNCGDWVESCTALVEHQDGELELLHWADETDTLKRFDLKVA